MGTPCEAPIICICFITGKINKEKFEGGGGRISFFFFFPFFWFLHNWCSGDEGGKKQQQLKLLLHSFLLSVLHFKEKIKNIKWEQRETIKWSMFGVSE